MRQLRLLDRDARCAPVQMLFCQALSRRAFVEVTFARRQRSLPFVGRAQQRFERRGIGVHSLAPALQIVAELLERSRAPIHLRDENLVHSLTILRLAEPELELRLHRLQVGDRLLA